ncbi:hypothetical protein VULLAG_LOCUS9446 [Vulpes lagopus]
MGREGLLWLSCIFLTQGYSGGRKTGLRPRLLELRCTWLPPAGRDCIRRQRAPAPRQNPRCTVRLSLMPFKASWRKEIHLKKHSHRVLFANLHIPKKTKVQFIEVDKIDEMV